MSATGHGTAVLLKYQELAQKAIRLGKQGRIQGVTQLEGFSVEADLSIT